MRLTPAAAQALVERVIAALRSAVPDADPETELLSIGEVEEFLRTPEDMDKDFYLALHALCLEDEQAVARGEEGPYLDDHQKVIEEAMRQSTWTMHPDYGCITKALSEIRRSHHWQEFDGSTAVHLSKAEIAAILRTTDPDLAAVRASAAAFAPPSDEDRDVYVMAKWSGREGELEVDSNAVISRGDDNGAYVGAFVWVNFSGTHLDVEEEDQDEDDEADRQRG